MRTIIFRAIRKHCIGEPLGWVYWGVFGMDGGEGINDVIPETIGQFTGLTDKNGVKIYEGDVVMSVIKPKMGRHYETQTIIKHHIEQDEEYGHWTSGFILIEELENTEVIGNIHENKNLLK